MQEILVGGLRDTIRDILVNNWQIILLLLGGMTGIGMILGTVKRVLGRLFRWAFKTGDNLATRAMDRPKPVMLLFAVLALVVPSCGAGFWLSPEKERPVIRTVTVSDNQEIRRLKYLLGEAGGKQAHAEAAASELARNLDSQRQRESVLSDRINDLQSLLAKYKPSSSDVEEEGRLRATLDGLHEQGVVNEVKTLKARKQFNYVRYQTAMHDSHVRQIGFQKELMYHKGCRACDQNHKTRLAMDVIWSRHPNWSGQSREDKDQQMARVSREELESGLAYMRQRMSGGQDAKCVNCWTMYHSSLLANRDDYEFQCERKECRATMTVAEAKAEATRKVAELEQQLR